MDISKEMLEAEKGFQLWEKLYKKNELTNQDRIVCFPEGENELTNEVLKQLNDYIEKKKPLINFYYLKKECDERIKEVLRSELFK